MPPKRPHLFESIDATLPYLLTEGSAKITLPKGKVFYNPVQQFNRDLSIAAIRTFFRLNPKQLVNSAAQRHSSMLMSLGWSYIRRLVCYWASVYSLR
jgi:tRNA G26 N,N-dimethylase Trm1